MSQADSVHNTPPLNTSALTPIAGLDWLDIKADTPPVDIFRAIGRLRREARDEIERLIRFLDESDDHMEREPDGDELDASYPESGIRVINPMEDDEEDDASEDDGSGEWSLGFLERHCSVYASLTVQTLPATKNICAKGTGAIGRMNTTAPSRTRTVSPP
jgi:hypothetical protein